MRLEDDKQKSLSSPLKESQSNLAASETRELIVPNLDISMYKERNDQYKILSNRLRMRASLPERKYIDKANIRILEKFFDPLRIRLRIMPINRAPQTIGKNADFYFIEGSKLGLKGDLAKAIEYLKRGLEIKPTHYLCRFNHAVILFKLGLILEATKDFQDLNATYPEDPIVAYNLAVALV